MPGNIKRKVGGAVFSALEAANRAKGRIMGSAKAAEPGKIYGFEVEGIDGKKQALSAFKGQVLLIVNTASLCGFTPQYESLEKLHRQYEKRGLRVLAFPANNFGAQEPGANPEIREFCRTRFSVSFDLFAKVSVKGGDIAPLYKFLTTESGFPGDITWNFSKFLVGRDGAVAARFGPSVDPLAKEITGKVEGLLG